MTFFGGNVKSILDISHILRFLLCDIHHIWTKRTFVSIG